MRVKTLVAWPILILGLSLPTLMDCSAAKDAADLASGCDELNQGPTAVASLSIDAKLKAFVQATADLQVVAGEIKADVKTACVNMATSLGVADTWTALGDADGAIHNDMGTGACDAASAKITAILNANANANATVIVSAGECTVNADVQAECEGSCKSNIMCTEPDVTVRCDPGQLTGQCDAMCNASAVCEGSVDVRATCKGTCSAECTGSCTGSCTGTITGGCSGMCDGKCDGVATPAGGMANCAGMCEGKCSALSATAMCTGQCSATCDGKCAGECKLDAMSSINCGAMVNCKGGCSVAYKAPKCEATLKPPMCTGDASCQASCSGRAELKAECKPATVKFIFTGDSADLVTLKTAIETNLPKIWLAAKTRGPIAAAAATRVVNAGAAAASAAATFGGKAIACVGAAASATVSASASVSVSVQASASVSTSCGAK
jgi:hypothetical protein